MTNTSFLMMATTAGFPRALVLDFLDQLGVGRWQDVTRATLAGLAEYAQDCDSEYGSQVRWDASQSKNSSVGFGAMIGATRSYHAKY